MSNNLEESLKKTIVVMNALNYVKLEEMDAMDQLYFIGSYMKFANEMEPLIKKYIKSDEHLNLLKEEKAKNNAVQFASILNLFRKEGENANSDNNSDPGSR